MLTFQAMEKGRKSILKVHMQKFNLAREKVNKKFNETYVKPTSNTYVLEDHIVVVELR